MSELILALLTWIAGETGLAMPPPPTVALVSEEKMNALIAGNTHVSDFRALYRRDAAIVYLRDDWNAEDLASRASLLHELVHQYSPSTAFRRGAPPNSSGRPMT